MRTAEKVRADRATTRRFLILSAAAIGMLEFGSLAKATDFYWDANGSTSGTGGTSTWDTASSRWRSGSNVGALGIWSNNSASGVIFEGTAGTVTLDSSSSSLRTFGNLTFNTGGYNLWSSSTTARTMNLNGAVTVLTADHNAITIGNGSTNPITFNLGSANRTFDIGTSDTLNMDATVIGTAGGITKNGAGVLSFTGANTFTGNITVNNGTFAFDTDSSLGNSANQINLNNGGTVRYDGGSALALTRLFNIDATANAVVTFNTTGANVSFNSSGTRGFTGGSASATIVKAGANMLTLTNNAGSPAVLGNWRVDAGTLAVSSSGDSGLGNSANGITLNGGTFGSTSSTYTLGASRVITLNTVAGNQLGDSNTTGNMTISGANQITGAGGFAKNGSGTLTISNTQNFTGKVTVTSGTLAFNTIGNVGGGNSALGAPTSAANGQIDLGGGTLQYTGSGHSTDRVINLTAASTINASGAGALTLDVASGNAITGSNMALTLRGTGSGIVNDPISIGSTGSLTKNDAGTWILAATNTYGTTTISAGILQIGNGASTGTVGTGAVANSGELAFNTTSPISFSNNITGTGLVSQNNSGTLSLSASGNTFSGGLNINSGTVIANNTNSGVLGSGSITMANGTTLDLNAKSPTTGLLSSSSTTPSITTTVAGTSTLTVSGSGTSTFAGVISNGSGTVALTKSGTGTQVITNDQTYTGTTTISAGTLQIGANGTTGSLGNTAVSVAGTLAFDRTDTVTYSGNLSGSGTLDQTGSGTLVLTGTTSNSSITVTSGTLQIGAGGTTGSVSGATAISSGATAAFNRSNAYSHTGALTGSGTVKQSGTGALSLSSASNTFSGGLNIATGTVIANNVNSGVLGSGTITMANGTTLDLNAKSPTTGLLSSTGTNGSITTGVAGTSTLTISGSTTQTFGGVIGNGSGTVALTKAGTGTQVLTNDQTYTGATTISAGTLQIGAAGTTGSLGNTAVAITGTLAFNRTDAVTYGGNLSGSGALTQSGSGSLTLTGTNSQTTLNVSAGTVILAGTNTSSTNNITAGILQVGNGGTTGTASGAMAISSGAIVQANRSNALTLAGNITGSGQVKQIGTGSLTLSAAANTFSGGLNIAGGSVIAGNANSGVLGSGIVTMADSTTLDLSARSPSISGLSTSGTGASTLITNSSATAATLTLNGGGTQTFAGSINNGAGVINLVYSGSGTQILAGANAYTGTTNVSNGTLRIGAGGTSGSLGTGAVTNTGTISFNRSDLVTVANNISSSGVLMNDGTGTTVLTGTNSYTGDTTINAGVVRASGSSLSSSSRIEINGGILESTGTITRTTTGTGGAGLRWGTSSTSGATGGLSAKGGTLTVDMGATAMVWNSSSGFLRTGQTLVFGSSTADSMVDYTRNIDLNAAVRTIQVTDNTGSTGDFARMSGVLSGTGGIAKTGAGTLELTGTNTYTGATNITDGLLKVTGSIAAGSTVTISGTGKIGGNGTINGAVVVNSGGILSPGSSPGTMNSGAQTWNGGASETWEINSASTTFGTGKGLATGYDWINITGALNLANLDTNTNKFTINLSGLTAGNVAGVVPGFDSSSSYDWVIATASAGITGFNSGKFILNDSAFTNNNSLAGGNFSILQGGGANAGTANDLILHFQPTPPSVPSSISLTTTATNTVLSDNTDANGNPGSTVAGSVHVVGSGSGYASEIDGLTGNASVGSATVDNAINNPAYIMLWLTGTGIGSTDANNAYANGAGLLGSLDAAGATTYDIASSASDAILGADFSALQTQYPGFTALVRFNSGMINGGAFNWSFSSDPSVLVDQIAIVPEPTTLVVSTALMAGLLTSRRRKAKIA